VIISDHHYLIMSIKTKFRLFSPPVMQIEILIA